MKLLFHLLLAAATASQVYGRALVVPFDLPGAVHNDYGLLEAALNHAMESRHPNTVEGLKPKSSKSEAVEGSNTLAAAEAQETETHEGLIRRGLLHDHMTLQKRGFNPLQPSVADWWAQGAPAFLRTYMDLYADGNVTKTHGLFGGLEHCYGLNSNSSQLEHCAQLRRSLGTEDPTAATLILTALQNLLAIFDLVYSSVDKGFKEAAEMIESLPYTKAWWMKFPADKKARFAEENVASALRDTVLSGLPWMTADAWRADAARVHANAMRQQAGAEIANANAGATSNSLNKWDQLFRTEVDLAALDEARKSIGYSPILGREKPGVLDVAVEGVSYAAKMRKLLESNEFEAAGKRTWEAFYMLTKAVRDRSRIKGRAASACDGQKVGCFYAAAAKLGQKALGDVVGGIFNGTLQLQRGDVFELLEFGNLLATDADAILRLTEVFPGYLAKRLHHKALNQALLADEVYITCKVNNAKQAHQFGAYVAGSTCLHDLTGPQDMKACLENEDVCYLYRWKEPASWWNPFTRAHSDKPAGIDEWSAPPHKINVTEIIVSSVGTALNGLKDFRLKKNLTPMLAEKATSWQDIASAAVPGTFAVPICYSDYSWNTPLASKTKKKHWWTLPCRADDPYCHERMLPCYCGPWGAQTKNVWDAIGHLKKSPNPKTSKDLCAKRIKQTIRNPLEAYVAYCRLDIRRVFGWTWENRVNGAFPVSGKDKFCDDVIGILERGGYATPGDMNPEVRYAIYCKILGDGRRCTMYNQMWKELVNGTTANPIPNEVQQEVNGYLSNYESEFERLVLEEAARDDDEIDSSDKS